MNAYEIIACIDRMDAAYKLGTPKLCENPSCSAWYTPTARMQTRSKYCPACRKKGIYHHGPGRTYRGKLRPKKGNGRQRMRENGVAVPGRKQAGRR